MENEKAANPPREIDRNELFSYFEKGKAFTNELMAENERLKKKALELQEKNDAIRARSADAGRLPELRDENARLRGELDKLEERFGEIEKENRDFAKNFLEIQNQNDNLLNLYVTSYQLHSTLDPEEVNNVIEQILLNLIGAEDYFVCAVDEKRNALEILIGESDEEGSLRGKPMESVDPTVGAVLSEGVPHFRENGGDSEYLACTPLKVKDEVIGAIAIRKLMDQKKEGFTRLDLDLLELMTDHAAWAIVSARVHDRAQRRLKTVENFLELLGGEAAG